MASWKGKNISFQWDSDFSSVPYFNAARFEKELDDRMGRTVEMYAERSQYMLDDVVKNWNTSVYFYVSIQKSKNMVNIKIYTDNDIFHYVSQGTSVRRAIMKRGFYPQTKSGSLVSLDHSGFGVAYVHNDVMMPGIKARRFEKQVVDFIRPKFLEDMQIDYETTVAGALIDAAGVKERRAYRAAARRARRALGL